MSTPTSLLVPLDLPAMTRHERLAQARTHAKYPSARSASTAHSWPESTYRAHEKGTRGLSLQDAEKYGSAFGVSGRWIYHGGDKMELLSPSRELMSGMKHYLPNAGQRRNEAQLLARHMPILGQGVGGEDGKFLMNGVAIGYVPTPPVLENVPGAYAIYVLGDSMESRYFAGELVYVHPNKPCKKNDFVVVQIRGDDEEHPDGYIKQFVALTPTTLILAQLNPALELEFPRKDVVSIHKIVLSGEG